MKVVILYRPNSEHARAVETFVHDFQVRHGAGKIELMNLDSREGMAMASLYDLTAFPAILALALDGMLLRHWQGGQLPLMDEVASYIYTP